MSLYENKSEDVSQDEDGIDLEALELVEQLFIQKREGTVIHKTIETDSYFRPSNLESLESYEEFVRKNEDKLSILAIDLGDPPLAEAAVDVMDRNKNVFGVAGYGPKAVVMSTPPSMEFLREVLLNSPKILAVGKVGLDFHFATHTNEKQLKLLEDQMLVAADMKRPVFVTSNKADKELLNLVREFNKRKLKLRVVCIPVVRSVEIFELCQEDNVYLLVRPEITYDEESLYRQCVEEVPQDRLLVASGGDLYAPEPNRGKWNSPHYLIHTIKACAKIFNEDPTEFTTQMALNFNAVFNTPPDAGDDEFYFTASKMEKNLIVTEAQLLENDIDEDGDELIICRIDEKTEAGSEVYWDRDNKRLIYTPVQDFKGADKFTYDVTDGRGGVDTANVTIHVTRKN